MSLQHFRMQFLNDLKSRDYYFVCHPVNPDGNAVYGKKE